MWWVDPPSDPGLNYNLQAYRPGVNSNEILRDEDLGLIETVMLNSGSFAESTILDLRIRIR